MIGKLRGFVDSIADDKCIIDVNGVGYVVFASSKTLQFLQNYKKNNSEVNLTIETSVKQDAIELYGFATSVEKVWFYELNKVQGVGAKVALRILGFYSIEEIVSSLISSDVKAFSKISGIGPKLAQRIVTELKDSAKKIGVAMNFDVDLIDKAISNIAGSKIVEDALSALENLGYKKIDCLKIVTKLIQDKPDCTLENLITSSLREISKNKFS